MGNYPLGGMHKPNPYIWVPKITLDRTIGILRVCKNHFEDQHSDIGSNVVLELENLLYELENK